jgi:diamine N-acetyltransferase
MSLIVELSEVTADTWRACADLEVSAEQRGFVSPVARYLCLCHYGGVWHPLAVTHDGKIVGFVMWAVDPDDRSGWVGGLVIGVEHQRRGYGRAALLILLERLRREQGCTSAAISYAPENTVAHDLYTSLGFAETGEREDDELVARLRFDPA